jgi:hypothetical protein
MVVIQVAIYPERAATIRAGLDPTTTSVAVDLEAITQDERDLLADHDGNPVDVATPTVPDLFASLRASAADERTRLDQVRDAFLAVLRERRTKTWQREIKPGGVAHDVAEPDWPSWRNLGGTDWERLLVRHRSEIQSITEGDEALAWTSELENLNRAAHHHAVAAQSAAEEAAEHQRQNATARLREWVTDHGSPRVCLLVEEGYESWYALAEDEFFTAHTPDGFTPLSDDHHVRSLPAPEARDIEALRDARLVAAAEEVAGEPDLIWVGRVPGPGLAPGLPAIRLTLTAHNGAQRSIWRPTSPEPSTVVEPAAAARHLDPTSWPDPDDIPAPTVARAIDDLRVLIDSFEDMRTDQMTDLFYAHAYNQLIESGRQLLEALEAESRT